MHELVKLEQPAADSPKSMQPSDIIQPIQHTMKTIEMSLRATIRAARVIWESSKRTTMLLSSVFAALRTSWQTASDSASTCEYYKSALVIVVKLMHVYKEHKIAQMC